MKSSTFPSKMSVIFLILLFNFHLSIAQGTERNTLQTYIVHVKQPEGRLLTQSEDLENWDKSFLPLSTTRTNTDVPQRMVYSYKNVIDGFAARLTEDELQILKKKNGFVSARPERKLRLHTTHTPSFLGLNSEMGVWKESNFGKGVIIGVLDGGILPSHPSFSDEGMPPPPAKWKGRCEFNISACNNKLIGARSFNIAGSSMKGNGAELPDDIDGHGTHVASTAAGGFVKNADALGTANGTAVGMAPYAHLAIYKVCFGGKEDCVESDILAGIDAAIEDGVDVLSLSMGGASVPFADDSIAVGSFAAIQKGIFVSCSAGNFGPSNSTLSNEAPWILTVGASTVDRSIVATAKLGNGEELDGESIFQPKEFSSTLLPLVYAGVDGNLESAVCANGSLNAVDVKGKVVLCERGGGIERIAKGEDVKNAGGAAMILMNDEPNAFSTEVDAHVLPATHVSHAAGLKIKSYINSTATPMATILFEGTVLGDPQSPAVASFSSRGLNLASPGILKPDIIGPGVSILAAWPFPLDDNTNLKFTFNMMSGTSMSCPHLSGIAALLKSSHPYWSPAAIKSAIMTTADLRNIEGKPVVDETLRACRYLWNCDEEVSYIVHRTVNCSHIPSITEGQLNYPSFSVTLGSTQTFTRTVTNVGQENSSYFVTVFPPKGVYVSVKTSRLYFSNVNPKATYSVTFSHIGSGYKVGEYAQGYIKWVSAKYFVRSPISVRFE
ncbi:hypothetical protein Pint_15968 [Pistacia integerrima]|uniref:Uncharacterized protein n=1 Tax=Pistacia integerrima TaxID=434235 RepID=A0ACC0ZA58_9ROSI|nr:hypothetical protein Pint_15968 [Pistacia integerrima]